MDLQQNTYDLYADEYVAMLKKWNDSGYSRYHNSVIPQVLDFLGDVAGRTLLDAGCGEGYLARLLASRGASVTAVDISPRLVELAKSQDSIGNVRYLVQNLSKGLPDSRESFDLVVSNLVLNDVYDYVGYIRTLGEVTKPGGRVVLSMNNPYSAVFREKARSYYDSGTAILYRGLSNEGVHVYHFHQTFEDYMTAFREAGFLLRSLSDLRATGDIPPHIVIEERMPFIIVLQLVKSKESASEIQVG
jgi:2-polyprenyl-3-methyl-5-hydroxy-6-metoxy-1,4-benzoquinol methylase